MKDLQFNQSIDPVGVVLPPDAADTPVDATALASDTAERGLESIDLWLDKLVDEPTSPIHAEFDSDFKLSIIVPVYNERSTILKVLARIQSLPVAKEIVVVDDFSTDGTRELLLQASTAENIHVIYHARNIGKGGAIRSGIGRATGEVIAIQDADLEYDPADLLSVIQPIVKRNADAVYGSRYLKSWEDGFLHRTLNRLLTEASNLFTGLRLTDMETCHKAFRRDVVAGLQLQQNRFGFEPEVTAKLARGGFRIAEAPVQYQARSYADGKKIGVRDLFNAFYCIVRYGLFE